jgi:hypothetical protein
MITYTTLLCYVFKSSFFFDFDKSLKNDVTTNLSKWILPQIIDVNISLKIVESIYTTAGRRFFTSTPYTGLEDVVVKTSIKEVAEKNAAKNAANQ